MLTKMPEAAFFTKRLSGIADRSAVEHKAVAEIRGMLGRQHFPQRHFDLYRILKIVHNAQSVCNAYAVGIHHS